jgi:hypothetical protein
MCYRNTFARFLRTVVLLYSICNYYDRLHLSHLQNTKTYATKKCCQVSRQNNIWEYFKNTD